MGTVLSKLTAIFPRSRKWLHRVTADPAGCRPTLAAHVIAEPNRAGSFSWVVMIADDSVKSMTGYSTEAAAKDAGVRWVTKLGHVVKAGGRSFVVGPQ